MNKNITNVKKNPIIFYCKEEIKQCYDKNMYPKPMWNKLKVMGNFTSIYTPWASSSKRFFKKLLIYMWPMFTHIHSFAPMCEL
jgi:hypothetical protein